jgi:hypothetical protein
MEQKQKERPHNMTLGIFVAANLGGPINLGTNYDKKKRLMNEWSGSFRKIF